MKHTKITNKVRNSARSMLTAGLLIGAMASPAALAAQMDYIWTGSQEIPDEGSTFVDIMVNDHGTIEDLTVGLVIEHTWQGDLIISVEHMDTGTAVDLLYRPGDSDGTGLGFWANNLGTVADEFIFSDAASAFYDKVSPDGIGNLNDPGIDDVSGAWLPYGSGGQTFLSDFDNMDIFGTWRLLVSDNANLDTGSIKQFSLHADLATTNDVPAPTSLILMALGLAGIGYSRKSKAS